ncbi:MAG TPA: NYN domain-containing protein [Pyrinomonadaceae bacterium]|nr:NYN domain-containing protein [Pyrinomonadaceae bacterium]
MSYLVDGNNVMAQRVGWHRDKSGARRGLLDELAAFAGAKRVTVAVVFDGAPEQFFKDGASYKGVRVFYAERGSNADERIKQMVEASRERRTLIVVTSDRALASYVSRCGAQVSRSGEFRRRLDETEKENAPPAVEENETIEDGELKSWMRYFGVEDGE